MAIVAKNVLWACRKEVAGNYIVPYSKSAFKELQKLILILLDLVLPVLIQ